jgi:hypothetical protein
VCEQGDEAGCGIVQTISSKGPQEPAAETEWV